MILKALLRYIKTLKNKKKYINNSSINKPHDTAKKLVFAPLFFAMNSELKKTFNKMKPIMNKDGKLEFIFNNETNDFFDNIVLNLVGSQMKIKIRTSNPSSKTVH